MNKMVRLDTDHSFAGARYVPPQMRKTGNETPSEAQIKLTRQLKGLLNRMSEQNISSIVDSVEEIYRNQRRHGGFTSVLTRIDVLNSTKM